MIDLVNGPAGAERFVDRVLSNGLQDGWVDGKVGAGAFAEIIDIAQQDAVVIGFSKRVHRDNAIDTTGDFGSDFGEVQQVVGYDLGVCVAEVFLARLSTETDGNFVDGFGFQKVFESAEQDDGYVFAVDGQWLIVVVFRSEVQDVVVEKFQKIVLNHFGVVGIVGGFGFEQFVEFVEDEDGLFAALGTNGPEMVTDFVGSTPTFAGKVAGVKDVDLREFVGEDAPDLCLAAAGGAAEETDAGNAHGKVAVEDQGGGFNGGVLADNAVVVDVGFKFFGGHVGRVVDRRGRRWRKGRANGGRHEAFGADWPENGGAAGEGDCGLICVFVHIRGSFRKDP